MFQHHPDGRCVYVVAKESSAEIVFTDWHNKFGLTLGKKVVMLTGETGTDLKLLAKGQVSVFVSDVSE